MGGSRRGSYSVYRRAVQAGSSPAIAVVPHVPNREGMPAPGRRIGGTVSRRTTSRLTKSYAPGSPLQLIALNDEVRNPASSP
jgi:hypothetical protein